MLGQQIMLWFQGVSDSSDLTQAGLLGGVILIAALAGAPLAGRLRESEALVRQRDLDLANLAELSQYIVERLRESLVVVDEQDRIRLINESATPDPRRRRDGRTRCSAKSRRGCSTC